MNPRPRLKVLTIVAIAFVVIGLLITLQQESPSDRAYRICKDCGLYEPEIDMLIEQYQRSGLKPAIRTDSTDPDVVEACRDCVEAVVEVVKA